MSGFSIFITDTHIYSGSHNSQRQAGDNDDGTKGARFKFPEWSVFDIYIEESALISPRILGMLSSWNKLCFTTGYIEVSVSLPGSPNVPGLWPGEYFFLVCQNENNIHDL